MTITETLARAREILERLAAGEEPDARTLAGATPVESWSIIPAEDVYRIGAVVKMAPAERAQPRIVPLLAIDVRHGWALVLFESQIRWWALGRPLPGAADTEGDAIMRLAAVWLRRWLQ